MMTHITMKHPSTDQAPQQSDDRQECSDASEETLEDQHKDTNQHAPGHDTPPDTCNEDTLSKNQHPCTACGKVFRSSGDLKRHTYTHTKEKQCTCSICHRSFTLSNHLKDHMFTHSEHKQHHCPVCSKRFTLQRQVKRHMASHQGIPNQCQTCGEKCVNHEALETHKLLHHNIVYAHKCEECQQTFVTAHLLKLHVTQYSDTRPYMCKTCQQRFHTSSALKSHMNGHSADKSFVCEVCGKKCGSRVCFTDHLTIHSSTKKHACQVGFSKLLILGNWLQCNFYHQL